MGITNPISHLPYSIAHIAKFQKWHLTYNGTARLSELDKTARAVDGPGRVCACNYIVTVDLSGRLMSVILENKSQMLVHSLGGWVIRGIDFKCFDRRTRMVLVGLKSDAPIESAT